MFYKKNLPKLERTLRLLAGAGITAFGILSSHGNLVAIASIATGATLVLTAFFGFCPMCAMVGRKPLGS